MIKEAEMIIRADGVVIVGHLIGECVRDISARDDLLCLARFVGKQQEGEDNTAHKEPFCDIEGDGNAAVQTSAITGEDLTGQVIGGYHGDSSKNIGDVDEEGFEDDDVYPEVFHAHGETIVGEISDINEVEFVVRDNFSLPCWTSTHGLVLTERLEEAIRETTGLVDSKGGVGTSQRSEQTGLSVVWLKW
jgi:hypothetical protein